MPASEMTAISVVPPPMSTIMLPDGSVIGMPAPGAAARRRRDQFAGWFGDGHAGADRPRHRLLDQMHFAGLGSVGAVFHRPLLDLRDLGRHANHDSRPHRD